MSARPHPRQSRTASSEGAGRTGLRLPWWAVALPVLAFALLLTLLLNPAEAHAATAEPSLGPLLERARHLLTR
ncbi:hypothetical protein ACSMX9_04310 [Streptomyces sp. LE64]|jgi:ABC-type uncharacterized transport system permease subunit|uniref:hypothetical protein n=1 Tax=unclassified Streptomyces TaxID=2593676 RepID=UPI00332EE360